MLRKECLVFALVAVFLVGVFACTKKQATEVQTEPEPATEVPAPPPEPPVEEVEEAPAEEPEMVKMPVLNDVFFDFDKSVLTDNAKQTLADNATQLKEANRVMVTIEGHCDERGTNAYNLALGERRAKAAVDYLVSLGVAADRMDMISYGEERPFDPGHSEAAWAKNRRAHFVIK